MFPPGGDLCSLCFLYLLLFLSPLRRTNYFSFLSSGGVAALVFTTLLPPFSSPSLFPRFSPPVSARIGWPPLEANFTLPEPCDFLEDVAFVELQRDDAEKVLKQYNEEGRKAGPPPDKRFDNRQGGFRGRGSGGSYQRYDNRDGFRGGYQNRSGDGGRGGEAPNFFHYHNKTH